MTPMPWKELFIRFTASVFCERLSVCVCVLLSLLVFKVGMWDLIVLVLEIAFLFTFDTLLCVLSCR